MLPTKNEFAITSANINVDSYVNVPVVFPIIEAVDYTIGWLKIVEFKVGIAKIFPMIISSRFKC